jgi:hypothetical protein
MTDGADDITALWAQARMEYDGKDFPRYGSQAWRDLPPDSPKRLASALQAAELWRRYGDLEELVEWLTAATAARPPLHSTKTHAQITEARKPKSPHQLHATPGWPPIAVPGRPGQYLNPERRAA